METVTSTAALWWAVVGFGLYHGINPGMGWPLAVSSALFEQKWTALPRALLALAGGHFLAMTAILLPFSLMMTLVVWEQEIRIFAALLVIALGLYLLINRRHPRMLVPLFLQICAPDTLDAGHAAAQTLMTANIGTAFLVAAAHTSAMIVAGGVLSVGMYTWLGMNFLRKSWFNLDIIWALSLVLVGAFGLWGIYGGH